MTGAMEGAAPTVSTTIDVSPYKEPKHATAELLACDEECPICLHGLSDESSTVQLACSHRFHRDCLYEFILRQMRSEPSRLVVCPMCKQAKAESDLAALVMDETDAILRQHLTAVATAATAGLSPVPRASRASNTQSRRERRSHAAFVRWAQSHHLRQCTTCSAPIEKNGGCNHMLCATCGTRFNWNEAPLAHPCCGYHYGHNPNNRERFCAGTEYVPHRSSCGAAIHHCALSLCLRLPPTHPRSHPHSYPHLHLRPHPNWHPYPPLILILTLTLTLTLTLIRTLIPITLTLTLIRFPFVHKCPHLPPKEFSALNKATYYAQRATVQFPAALALIPLYVTVLLPLTLTEKALDAHQKRRHHQRFLRDYRQADLLALHLTACRRTGNHSWVAGWCQNCGAIAEPLPAGAVEGMLEAMAEARTEQHAALGP